MNDTAITETEFWEILHKIPEPVPVYYRLYYDDKGAPIIYSMEDLPHNYIEVDQQTYVTAPSNVRVVDGKLTHIKPVSTVKKLESNELDGTACDPRDVCIIVDQSQKHTKWKLNTYEIN